MQLQGSYHFQASQDDVWDALLDPTILAQALPGGEALTQVGENQYQAVLNLRVGPVQGRFEGSIELSDIEPKSAYTMKVQGQGAPGFLNGSGRLKLAPVESGGVELTYQGEVQVGGKIAGLSQRLVESTARSVIKQGLAALDAQILLRKAPKELVTPPPAPLTAQRESKEMVAEGGPVFPPEGDPTAQTWKPIASPSPRPLESRGTMTRPSAVPGSGATSENAGIAPQAASFTATATASFGDLKFARNVAADVVGDIAADYIPRRHHEKVLWAAIGAAGAFLFVALVRLVQKR